MQDESRPWTGDYGTEDEQLTECSWCGQVALCVVEENDWRTCARCWDEPNPQTPVQHEVLRLFTPVDVLRGQMGLA